MRGGGCRRDHGFTTTGKRKNTVITARKSASLLPRQLWIATLPVRRLSCLERDTEVRRDGYYEGRAGGSEDASTRVAED